MNRPLRPKSRLRHIAFITGNYPSWSHPSCGTFVRQLVEAVAELGVRCTVIHPWKFHEWLREHRRVECDSSSSPQGVKVHRPVMLSLSNRRIGPVNTYSLSYASFQNATWRILSNMREKPDALYGHFLYAAGAVAVWAGSRLGRPSFVAVGEGTFWTLRPFGIARARLDFAGMAGAVAVSTVLRERLIQELGFPSGKLAVFPNGVDFRKFYPRDRQEMRSKHGLAESDFLVIYVGNFIESKGVSRLADAIDGMPGVSGIFVGAGPRKPRISNLAFCGRLPHEMVPEFLSAADCFVLPSDVEGCSNATLEAMACGLPIVTSRGRYMDDIVDDEIAIRVDPMDASEIRAAIQTLANSPERCQRMSEACLRRVTRFGIAERARLMTEWMSRIASDWSGTRDTESRL